MSASEEVILDTSHLYGKDDGPGVEVIGAPAGLKGSTVDPLGEPKQSFLYSSYLYNKHKA